MARWRYPSPQSLEPTEAELADARRAQAAQGEGGAAGGAIGTTAGGVLGGVLGALLGLPTAGALSAPLAAAGAGIGGAAGGALGTAIGSETGKGTATAAQKRLDEAARKRQRVLSGLQLRQQALDDLMRTA